MFPHEQNRSVICLLRVICNCPLCEMRICRKRICIYVFSLLGCILSLEAILKSFPLKTNGSDIIGYVEKDGVPGFSINETISVDDSLEEGLIVQMKDGCNNW